MSESNGQIARRIIVGGSSAGGIEVWRHILGRLRADLPAAVLIVQHTAQRPQTLMLPRAIADGTPLRVAAAEDGQVPELGHVYVAPPGAHLLLVQGRLRLGSGPRENMHRPAVDPLFRSAAVDAGAAVIGVILSGMLDDGTSGLAVVKRLGGLTIAQDPSTAAAPDMPANAIRHAEPHLVLDPTGIAEALTREAGKRVPAGPPAETMLQREVQLALQISGTSQLAPRPAGSAEPLTCPECGGPLTQQPDVLDRYRCHVGHGQTAGSLLAGNGQSIEDALWIALRSLREREHLLRRILDRTSRPNVHGTLEGRLAEVQDHARRIEQLLESVVGNREAPQAPAP